MNKPVVSVTKKPASSKAERRWTLTVSRDGRVAHTHHYYSRTHAIEAGAYVLANYDQRVDEAEDALRALKRAVIQEYSDQIGAETEQAAEDEKYR